MAAATKSPTARWELPPPPPPAHYRTDGFRPMDLDIKAATNAVARTASPSPDHHHNGRSSSVSLDDPDVRLAAEALGDLRADFVSSPPSINATLPMSPPMALTAQSTRSQSPQGPEPLLSLLTTSHPLLASTIENATSAYGGAKNFSPRFKVSAEYVEGYLTPLANTVGSVGRATGVEGGVRWFLGAGRRKGSDLDGAAAGNSKKRRKVEGESDAQARKRLEAEGAILSGDLETLQDSFPSTPKSSSRRLSFASTVDTLPAYDEMRSPAYTETLDMPMQKSQSSVPSSTVTANAAWQSRLIMSTSGLSVAMSDESLRSLKFCLRWLRWANEHIGGVIGNLKITLEQYENPEDVGVAQLDACEGGQAPDGTGESRQPNEKTPEESRAELATRINSLKSDVLKTLQDGINMVSKYAGGALPENARVLVRRHLTSLPQRFRLATMTEGNGHGADGAANLDNEAAVREGAQKVLVLAKEGLDMMSQVSGVLDGTIVSAEEWCERMGRRRRHDSQDGLDGPILPITEPTTDIKMG